MVAPTPSPELIEAFRKMRAELDEALAHLAAADDMLGHLEEAAGMIRWDGTALYEPPTT